jgi:hypothetical protein
MQLRQVENGWSGAYFKEPPALFLFIRNDKGRVAQMLHTQDGRAPAAKKIK